MSSAVNEDRVSTKLAEAAYAYSIVAHQDSLLQSYRGFQITFQSTLLAIASATLVLAMQVQDSLGQSLSIVVLVLLAGLARFIGWRLNQVITARGFDVNLAQRAVLSIEQSLPTEQRRFSRFKLDQNQRRRTMGRDDEDLKRLLHKTLSGRELEATLDRLFQVAKAHTRGQLERTLPMAMNTCWVILLVIGLVWLSMSTLATWL